MSFRFSESIPPPFEEMRSVRSKSVRDALFHVEIGTNNAGHPVRTLAFLHSLKVGKISEKLFNMHIQIEFDFLHVKIRVVEGTFLRQRLAISEKNVV